MYKKRIGIGIIHNNNTARNKKLFSNVELLKQKLERDYEVQLAYVSFQPTIREHSLFRKIYRDFMYWKINREWLSYRLLKKRNLLLDFLFFLKNIILRTFKQRNNCKASFIETVVTDKHIRAWNVLLEKNDYFIFFEDDAVFFDDSNSRLLSLLNYISKIDKESYVYVDLAGGCSLDDLQVYNLEQKRNNKYIYYNKPVTNTACSYLINKQMMYHFFECCIASPTYRQIGIDWMINKMLIDLDRKSIRNNSICLHANPTIFKHGSASGLFKPWERK